MNSKNLKSNVNKWKSPHDLTRREEIIIVTRGSIGHSHLACILILSIKSRNQSVTRLSIRHAMIDCSKFADAREILKNPISLHRALDEENYESICKSFHKINEKFKKL